MLILVTLIYAVSTNPQIQNTNYAIISGLILVACCGVGYYLSRKAGTFKPTSAEMSALYAFRTGKGIREYLKSKSPDSKKESHNELQRLVTQLSARWDIADKAKRELLEDFDFLVNPIVRLVFLLDKTYSAIIEGNNDDELRDAGNYFENMSRFFLNPTKEGLDALFTSAKPLPLTHDRRKRTLNISALKGKPWIRHASVLGGSVVAALITYLITSPFSPDPFQPLTISLTVAFGIAGVYGAFLRK